MTNPLILTHAFVGLLGVFVGLLVGFLLHR